MQNQYKEFQKNIDFLKDKQFDNISLELLLAVSVAGNTVKKTYKCNIIQKIKMLISVLIKYKEMNISKTGNKKKTILFQKTEIARQDYRNIENDFINKINNEYSVIQISFNDVYDLNIFKILKNLKLLLSCYNYAKKIDFDFYNFFETFIIFCQIMKIDYNQVFNKFCIDGVVAFCDVHSVDNYLIQIANNKNIPTFTLQHGMMNYEMRDYGDLTFLHFEYSPAKNIFVWGEEYRNQLVKYSNKKKENIFIAGNQKIATISKHVLKNNKTFLVILDSPTPEQEKINIEMIKIANLISDKYKINFRVRSHPFSKYDYTNNIIDKKNCILTHSETYDELIGFYDFVILHNTSMYYELSSLNMPCFRFKDNYVNDVDNMDCNKFADFAEFINKYENYNQSIVSKHAQKYINTNVDSEAYIKGLAKYV